MIKTRFLLFVMLLPLFGLAQQKEDISCIINSAGSAEDYNNAGFVTIFDRTEVEMQPSGLSYFQMHSLYKILTPAGAKEKAIIKYGYDPLTAFVELKEVTIYRKNGKTEKLDVSKVLDYAAPARMIYWGAREIMLEVGKLEVGDAVELKMFKKGFTYALLQTEPTAEEDEQYIPPMRGHFYDIVPFYSTTPLLEKVYTVSVPEDKVLQYDFYNGEAKSSMLYRDGRYIYTFIKKDILPIKRESNMVAFDDVLPKLLLSTSPDWQAKSSWFYGVNEDYGAFESIPEVKAKVDEILVNAKTAMDSVSLLTHWVADEIRYSGLSMGEGEGFTLHNAKMNFTDRCGVCKDKASMLITMLRAAGFESYPAMTMAGSRIDYIPADQFNHCVTVVKVSDKFHVLDPTWVPFTRELWSSLEQQQNYLMGLPEGADLSITDISPAENHYLKLDGVSTIDENGTLSGEFLLIAEGQEDASIRRLFTSNYKADWEEAIRRELLAYAPFIEISEMDFGKPYDYLSGPLNIKIKYKVNNYATVTNKEIFLKPFLTSGVFKRALSHLYMNTNPEKKSYDFKDRCSRLIEINEVINLPKGYKLETLTDAFKSDVASAEYTINQKNHQLNIQIKVRTEKRVYESHEWPDFKKAVVIHKDLLKKTLILKK